jgi:hypothetical protein
MSSNDVQLTIPTSRERSAANFLTPPPPASLFQGYDSVNGSGISTAVEGTYVTTGGSSRVVYNVTEDVESLYQALDISQSVSVGFGPFGSVNEKSQFVQQLNLTTYSLNIVVHASHIKGVDTATAFKLHSDIAPPSGNEQLNKFFRSYGDSFLSSLTTGAEYYAVYTFYAQSKEERDTVSAQLSANGIFDFGTVGADFQSKIDRVTKSTQTRISFSQNVAGIANPRLPSPNELVQYALNFPSVPIDAPTILSFGYTGYEHVPGVNGFDPIVKNRVYFQGTNNTPGLAQNLAQISQLDNQIDWLKQIYAFYQNFSDSKLNEAKGEAEKDINAINAQLETYVNDPTASFQRPPLHSLSLGSPVLQYQVSQPSAHGGDGGDPFNDVDVNSYLQKQTRIASVQLRSGKYVDALVVTYQTKDGGPWTVQHGGGGGNLSQNLSLLPGQFVTKLAGRSGGYVDQFVVTLSDGRSVGGGGGGGDPFNWAASGGGIVLGFYGRSGRYLDQVGVVVGTLQAAKWVQ